MTKYCDTDSFYVLDIDQLGINGRICNCVNEYWCINYVGLWVFMENFLFEKLFMEMFFVWRIGFYFGFEDAFKQLACHFWFARTDNFLCGFRYSLELSLGEHFS